MTELWILIILLVLAGLSMESKFSQLIKVQRHATTEIQRAIKAMEAATQELAKIREDTTKTLQWMVDNWPER